MTASPDRLPAGHPTITGLPPGQDARLAAAARRRLDAEVFTPAEAGALCDALRPVLAPAVRRLEAQRAGSAAA